MTRRITCISGAILFVLVSVSAAMGAVSRFHVIGTGEEPIVYDRATGLEWQQVPSHAGSLNWADALSHCENLDWGEGNWRLPDVKELMTLVDEKKTAAPAINTSFFQGFSAMGCWTSTTGRALPSAAYVVYFGDFNSTVGRGGMDVLPKSTSGAAALCVRTAVK